MIARGLPFILVIALTSATSAGQLPSSPGTPDDTPGTGVIIGQVIDPGSGRGVPGVIVSIAGPPATPVLQNPSAPVPTPNPASLTTADGRFLFRDLRKGTYFITASKPGYLTGAHGARRPGGGSAPIDLDDGEHVTDAVVPVWKWGTLSGTVTDEAGEPVVGLEVRAYRRGIASGRRQFSAPVLGSTDDRGEYRISNLMPGEYVVAAVGMQSSLPMAVAETLRDTMQGPGPDPTRTSIMSAMFEAGARTPPMMPGMSNAVQVGSSLQTVTGPVPPPVTDEARVLTYPTTFHPAARTLREATVLTLRSGEDRTGIDFDLKPLRATRVSGTIVGPDGPGALIAVRLEPADGDIVIEPEAVTMTDASGAFVFPSVPSGQYTLRASRVPRPTAAGGPMTIVQSGGMTVSSVSGPAPALPPASTDPTLWAAMPLAAGQTPLTGMTITMQTGSRVSGRIVFEGTADRPDAAQMQRLPILLEPEGGALNLRAVPPGRVDADGNFSTGGVPGGRYFVRSPVAPPNWHFKEARHESIDLADVAIALEGKDVSGVTIVFTDRPTELSGTIRSGQGTVDPDATVLVFPAEPERWQSPNPRRMRSVRASKDGVFKTTGLPPGDYYAVAVPDESTVDWQDSRLLASFARDATRISLDDGEKRAQDLRTQQKR
jgi:Carboxypeptidase regulatory-like domain